MNKNLSRTIKYLKRYRREIMSSVIYVVLFCIVVIVLAILLPKPNNNISPSNKEFLFENINPTFEVGFGDILNSDTQYVRFESKSDVSNPFEQEEVTIWDRVKNIFSKKHGFEMRLTEVRFGETDSNFVRDIGQEIISVIEGMEVDNIKTDTEVIDVGRLLGEYDDNSQSKKTVINRNVYPGIDIEYQILEEIGVKEEIVIRNIDEYTSNCGGNTECLLPLNEFVFDLILDEDVVLKEAFNVVMGNTKSTYYLTNQDGMYLAHFLPTFAVDYINARTNDVDMVVNHISSSNYEIVVTLDPDWLFSEERVFPIRIDPSIVHDTTIEFNSGYTYNTEIVAGSKVQINSNTSSDNENLWSSGVYRSPIIDLEGTYDLNSIEWTEYGGSTNDGETPYSTTGLIGKWDFNEVDGILADNKGSCGDSCDGILHNMTTTQQDIVVGSGWTSDNRRWGSGAVMFDGSNDYISIPNNASLNFDYDEDFTVTTWFRQSMLGSSLEQDLLVKYNGVGLQYPFRIYIQDSKLRACRWDSVNTPCVSYDINDTEYHYLNFIKSGPTLNLYIDGVLRSSTTDTTVSSTSNSSSFCIGSRCGGSNSFNGIIDSVSIYNRVLSLSEILSNYNSGNVEFRYRTSTDGSTWTDWSGTQTPLQSLESGTDLINSSIKIGYDDGINESLVLYYSFDETNGNLLGNDIFDSSGNDRHGEIYGDVIYSDGFVKGGRYLDGLGDYISVGSIGVSEDQSRTIAGWIKSGDITQVGPVDIFGFRENATINESFDFQVDSDGNWVLCVGDTDYDILSNANRDDSWRHIAASYDGSNIRIYLDGIIVGIYVKVLSTVDSFQVGVEGSNYWEGYLDDIVVFNQELSSNEIHDLYSLGIYSKQDFTISSIDISDSTMLPFWIASDELGSNIQMIYGKSEYVNYGTDSHTMSLWHMDEGVDDSNGGDVVIPSLPTVVNGVYGRARDFDGLDDYIDVSSSVTSDISGLTIETWIKSDNYNRDMFIFEKGSTNTQYSLFFEDSNTCFRTYNSSGIEDSFCVPNISLGLKENEWNYIVATYDSSYKKVYINGVLKGSKTYSQVLHTEQSDERIGASGGDVPSYFFNGSIDELRISDIAQSGDEIRQIYEIDRRSCLVSVNFKADLLSSNLITNSNDKSFGIDERSYGVNDYIQHIDIGETIIVKENYGGIEYIAQGEIDSLNTDTGAVIVSSWDTSSTFPINGFTVNATVFKWQREYIDVRYLLDEDINAITNLTFRRLTSIGANFWINDIKQASFFGDSSGSTFTQVEDIQYIQYEAIFTRWGSSPGLDLYLTQVDMNYSALGPTMDQIMRHGKWFDGSGEQQSFWWVNN